MRFDFDFLSSTTLPRALAVQTHAQKVYYRNFRVIGSEGF